MPVVASMSLLGGMLGSEFSHSTMNRLIRRTEHLNGDSARVILISRKGKRKLHTSLYKLERLINSADQGKRIGDFVTRRRRAHPLMLHFGWTLRIPPRL